MSIEAITTRLERLHPRLIDLSLDRLHTLLARLGNPHHRLPPVIHVAGTNGKGSTCAFIRAMAEAAGLRVHVYISPHLVRFNERIRIAGELVSDDVLIATLERLERINDGAPITVFELITAAAFDLFAATPADLCVLEVGLGGRGDATNVIDQPAACAITSISLDHREFLGPTLPLIAGEKAGIIKSRRPVVIGAQPEDIAELLLRAAAAKDAPAHLRGRDWEIAATATGLRYTDTAGTVDTPPPSLLGQHQIDNAGIALAALLPPGWELWLDGGHNPGAGQVLAEQLQAWSDQPVHLVVGMKQAKDTAEFLAPLLPRASTVWAVQEPGQHNALPVETIVAASRGIARPGPRVTDALRALSGTPSCARVDAGREGPARVLICGSLYLAGEVLKLHARAIG
ncbi:MAG TPA: folylpolyglutamate synthase/dihydrofolate synthase family protein [Rhodopila sp.]|nr:folylpolyglutamate synthase/dihydrofolate synthase family protein [Rhodopila sp.]